MSLETVLQELRKLHQTHADVRAFCPMPDDVVQQDVVPFDIPPRHLMEADQGLTTRLYPDLRDALIAIGPQMQWRETYKDTDIGADFMDRFGCYEIIGVDAPFASSKMRSFLVYQPPHLHYPWHHHPADELYVVIAGEAEFHLQDRASEVLTSGQAAFHPSNTPHALTTHDHPVMTYVLWRDEFDTAPVWSDL